MSYSQKLKIIALSTIAFCQLILQPGSLWAGDYQNSAHGSSSYGVDRLPDYATGNCAHCHEMHASIAGSEPCSSGGANPYTLFATNFNSGTSLPGSYQVADNFCFNCHSASLLVQPVANKDYSATFGGAATEVQSIMDAFNQPSSANPNSYHDLADIHAFAEGKFPWYTASSNPCSACHNPHLAKKNYEDFLAPLSSAISKPSAHFSLWGEGETMLTYSNSNSGDYLAPYSDSSGKREPDKGSTTDGSKTPDYVGFCTDCHNTTNTDIFSTKKGDYLLTIDWSGSGEKHGGLPREVVPQNPLDVREPYNTAQGGNTNFTLSCLDCHEPHGSSSIMLIRRRVNGENLEGDITTTNNMSNLCKRCHTDDQQAVGGASGQWRHIHHDADDAPYPGPPNACARCHKAPEYATPVPGSKPRIHCGLCHHHGSDDSWMDIVDSNLTTGRKTF